ncbi:MAG TPA: retropepsin-like aspartic protease [Rhizomicrobium sp.]|jgi:clan AA aspartic protease (TIGR02281 family)|nr:retropepsin-like aspartic protease [Rhizomicrobium sp.]
MFRHLGLAAILAAGTLAAASAAPASVPMRRDGGVYVVPVSVNGIVTLDCVVDSGAADVNIPADVFRKLVRAGTVTKADFLGTTTYTLADGTDEPSRTFRIHSLKVGNIVLTNVTASIGGTGSMALLGQSFLGRFRSWSLDNTHHMLALLDPLQAPVVADRDPPASHIRLPPGHPGSDGTVAQTSGGPHGTEDDSPAVASRQPDPDDGRLTAQHSDSH